MTLIVYFLRTVDNFNNKTSCMIQQYEKYYIKEVDKNVLKTIL
jgi:hypothetical protein